MKDLDNFFGFGEAMASFDKLIDDLYPLLSNCCRAKAYTELFRNFGRCSECLKMTEFSKKERSK